MSSNKSSVSTCTSTEDFWCSTVEFHKAEFVWKISDFSSLDETGERIKSDTFSSPTNDKFTWYLDFHFRGLEDETDIFCLFLNLKKENASERVFAKFSFSILNNEEEEIYRPEPNFECHEFYNEDDDDPNPGSDDDDDAAAAAAAADDDDDDDDDDNWGWDDCPKKNKTFRSKFLQNDTLTISFQMIFFEMNHKNLDSMFRRCNTIHLKQLSDNLASVLENPNFADFTITAKGKNYQVHKNILAARSTYFAKMFESGMKENQQNCVEITDVNEDIMGEMLKFIYTGMCENLDKLADDLLIAANKYDIDHLKQVCVESIYSKSLCVENALKILILADQYNANKLKSRVIDFIVANSSEIMASAMWDEIMPAYPHLLNSVCKEAMRRFLVLSKTRPNSTE
ncbi:speckle-type POZ protein B-like [Planococcus citri]|uniref:speckle-type POZ protein B-like n=1 Tax=Planococcus citri TaxID=170843 RepID=UPI0031F7F544